ncbi:MAG: DUF4272 domain-containing protein [Planctomycetota bacterium]
MNLDQVKAEVIENLNAMGFRPANWLPTPTGSSRLRAAHEIAARLMALHALFTWVVFSEDDAASDRIQKYVVRNRLLDWLCEDEAAIMDMNRSDANQGHVDTIGWQLENMWPLAWVLGFEPEPSLAALQIPDEITNTMIFEFLLGLDATVDDLISKANVRASDVVVRMEYVFYCAHNAVRSAQLGESTVPAGFHPIIHGGAIHERRHSLTWCVTENVTWDETDLST